MVALGTAVLRVAEIGAEGSLCVVWRLLVTGACPAVNFCVPGRLCVNEAFAVVSLWVLGIACVTEEFAMMGVWAADRGVSADRALDTGVILAIVTKSFAVMGF